MTRIKVNVPDGCKAVTVNVDGENVMTEFEPKQEKFEPKDGDYVTFQDIHSEERWIGIFRRPFFGDVNIFYVSMLKSKDSKTAKFSLSQENAITIAPDLKPATDEQIKLLKDEMRSASLRWNPLTKRVEGMNGKIVRFSVGNYYYYIGGDLEIHRAMDEYLDEDNRRYSCFNYFRSYSDACRIACQIREIFKNSKAE